MELDPLVEALRAPGALPDGETVEEVRRTHISVVLLTAAHAYKLKRPLDLGFLDYTTRDRRQAHCEAEVRLNRRLAPHTYLGVVHVGPDDEPAVKMRRLPDDATLLARLEAGTLSTDALERVARTLGRFHQSARRDPEIDAFGGIDTVAGNALENFDQSTDQVGEVVHEHVHRRLREITEATLAELRPVFEARVRGRRIADTHGDLRLEHVYLLDDPDEDLDGDGIEVLDGIEFNDRFRFADVVSDIAFLTMDLAVRGRRDLARLVADAWIDETGDDGARTLWPFYSAYRSAVRGKVAGFTLADADLDPDRRAFQHRRASRHWLFAWTELAPPDERPWLLGIGGRPGTGKSTLARALAERAGFEVLRTDVIRKELAGLSETDDASAAFGEGLYSPEARQRVYDEILRRAGEALFAGRRVIIDASLCSDRWRVALVDLAERWGVPGRIVRCEASPEIVEARLRARTGDASDADVDIYRSTPWEPASDTVAPHLLEVRTDGSVEQATEAVLSELLTP